MHVGKERDGVAAIHGVLDQWLFVASARRVKAKPALVAREQGGVGVMAAIVRQEADDHYCARHVNWDDLDTTVEAIFASGDIRRPW